MYLYNFLKVSSKRPSISSSNATCYHSTINIEATEYLKVKTSANRDSKEVCKTLSAAYYLLSVVSHKPSQGWKTAFLSSLGGNKKFENRCFEVGLRWQSSNTNCTHYSAGN